jgi:hypothetical protein
LALDKVTHVVALALNDQGLRQRVRNDLRDSRFTVEHKLPFNDYIKGESGGILLAKMDKESELNRDEILALLNQIRPLEFYMPVDEHRETWTGGTNLYVGSILEDEDTPTVYDLSGQRFVGSLDAVPATPTLAIVPVETDFSQVVGAAFQNANADGGAIGTWQPIPGPSTNMQSDCDSDYALQECDSSSGGGGTIKPAGLYMTYSQLDDLGEHYFKGNPEIEVHIHGPNSGGSTVGADLACAGGEVSESVRQFDQNGNTWSGEALLFSQDQIEAYDGTQGFNVMVWEDDDTACLIKTDKDITGLLELTAGLAGTAVSISTGNWLGAAAAFIGTVYQSASWLMSNDEFLGDAGLVQGSSNLNVLEPKLYIGHQQNGELRLELLYTN